MALSARPGLHLADYVMALAPSGNPAPLTGTIIRATPSVIPLFVRQADSSYVPATQATQIITVAGDGSWTLVLPAQSDCQPNTVNWSIALPDGSTYNGVVTDAMVTASQSAALSLHDLTATYGWGMVASALTPVVTLQGAKGEPGTGVQILGAYNSALQYVANDVVSVTALDNTVSTYYALQTVPPATPPPNGTYWAPFVSAGAPGAPGATADATTSTVGGALINRAPSGAHPVVPVLDSGGLVAAADLPIAAHTTRGTLKVGNSLRVDGAGLVDVTQEISLKAYGDNVGTGSNVADEAAMDAWLADTTHRTLFIPEGAYSLTKAYNIAQRGIRGAGIGRTIITAATPLGAVNSITAGFTGTFTLTLADTSHVAYTTQAIAVGATAAEIQTAIAALACVPAPSDISVSGVDGGPWQVTYQGNLAGTLFDPIVVNNRLVGPYVASTINTGSTISVLGSKPEIQSVLTQKGGAIHSVTYNQVETLQACNTPKPFLTITGDDKIAYLRDFTLFGPSGGITDTSGAMGQKLAHADGIHVYGQIELRDVVVGGFDHGVILANYTGHEVLRGVQSRGNYYGIYDIYDGGDVYMENCLLDNNHMATIGIGPENSQGLASALLDRCHLGGAPYVFYGEYHGGTPTYQMLAQVQMHNCPSESVGNGVIYSEGWDVTGDPTKLRAILDVIIERSGFYWSGSTQRLPSSRADKNYCFRVGSIAGTVRILDDWQAPFVAGDVGTWYIAAQDQGQTDIYSGGPNPDNGSQGLNTSSPLVGSGIYNDSSPIYKVGDHDVSGVVPPRFYLHRNNGSSEGTGTILAGQTFVDIATGSVSPHYIYTFIGYNCHPVVTPTSDPVIGGVAGTPFTLMVSNVSSIPGIKSGNLAQTGAGTSFRVSVLGGVPTVPLTFFWRIR